MVVDNIHFLTSVGFIESCLFKDNDGKETPTRQVIQAYGSCKCNHMHPTTFSIFHSLETSHRPYPLLKGGDHTRMWTQKMRITGHHICCSHSTTNLTSKGAITFPESTNLCIWPWARVCQWQKLLCHLENISEVKAIIHRRLWDPDTGTLQTSSEASVLWSWQLLRFPHEFYLFHTFQCVWPKSLLALSLILWSLLFRLLLLRLFPKFM